MKVLLVNGSPHEKGCTYTALAEVAAALEQEGIETEIFSIGRKPVGGCVDCGGCGRPEKRGSCVFGDPVNACLEKAAQADGFVFGAPVYYAGVAGSMSAFMDRLFMAGGHREQNPFALKPAAAVTSARRAGTTATLDRLNKYFLFAQMPVISSSYWNMVHGNTPEEVRQDKEGLQVMRTLGRNMAFFLKCKAAGLAAGVPLPSQEAPVKTNFIR